MAELPTELLASEWQGRWQKSLVLEVERFCVGYFGGSKLTGKRVRDVPYVQVPTLSHKMWSGAVRKCQEEIKVLEISQNLFADEHYLNLLQTVDEIVRSNIDKTFR